MPATPSTAPSLLFVYGTLRRDARPLPVSPLCRDWVFRGYGTVPGELWDFGPYPGAVPPPGLMSSEPAGGGPAATDRPRHPPGSPRIRGEVYALPKPDEMLPLVDRYEGCAADQQRPFEFERELVRVDLEDGGTCEAWIYWYKLTPRGRKLVTGDYVERTGSG